MRLRQLIAAATIFGVALFGARPAALAQPALVPCNGAALQSAVEAVDTAGGGTLNLTPFCDYVLTEPKSLVGNPNGANGFVRVTTTMRINGNGASISRPAEAPAFRFFWIEGGNLTLNNLTLRGGRIDGGADGGAIYVPLGALTLNRCTVTGNSVSMADGGHGGGIRNRGALTVNDSVISNNTAGDGAGVHSTADTTEVIFNRTLVTGNRASLVGGGIESIGPGLTLNDTLVVNNEVNGPGAMAGGIFTGNGPLMLNRSAVLWNSVSGDNAKGGGIVSSTGIEATLSSVHGNTATGMNARGGGILNVYGDGVLNYTSVVGNRALGTGASGGGIFREDGSVTLVGALVFFNSPNNCGSPSTVAGCQ